MLNKYANRNDMGVKDAFQVQWDKIVEEKRDELQARLLIPFTDGTSNGITLADKSIEYRKVFGIGKARISDERIDDIPFVNVQGGFGTAKLHWLTIGFKLGINDITNILSGKKIPDLEANNAFRIISETENDLLLFGDEALGREGLLTVTGKRTHNTGVTLSTATGADIVNAMVAAVKEFKTGVQGIYNARTLAMHPELYYELQRVYATGMDSGDSTLSRIENRRFFQRILPINNLVNATTKNPTMLILDDAPENFQVVEVMRPATDEWTEGRNTITAIEEKLSEVIAFYPDSIMEVIFS